MAPQEEDTSKRSSPDRARGRISAMVMTPDRIRHDLELPDLTDEAQSGVNPVNLVMEKIINALAEDPDSPPIVRRRGERIVTVGDNFDNLLIPPHAPSRLPQYVRYVDTGHLFRTHTSAMMPAVLREVVRGTHPDDFIVACPGITFRRDVIDPRHTDTPHQMDLWRIRKMGSGEKPVAGKELREVINMIVRVFTPSAEIRFNKTSHPYTLNGVEVEVQLTDGSWLELLEAGELNPRVLRQNGVPQPEKYTGWAIGIGLDRLAMYVKKMRDIRYLRAQSSQIRRQMSDLKPFIDISRRPPLKRKVSLVSVYQDTEVLAERLREIDPALFALIGELQIVEKTPIDKLNDSIRTRLGARAGAGQVNYLLEIDVNPVDHSPTDDEANQVVLAVYNGLNETDVPLPPFKKKRTI